MTNQDYKNASLAALKGKWAPALICSIIFFLLIMLVVGPQTATSFITMKPETLLAISAGGSLLSLILYGPLYVGFYGAFRRLLTTGDDHLTKNFFSIGFGRFFHNMVGYILMTIKVFLWALLLIIPGIVKSFAYAMTPFILEDEPELSPLQAIKKSDAMMKGHKFDFFYLTLSFIGWLFLSVFTLFIGLFWLMPYMQGAYAAFYEDVKAQYAAPAEITANN